MALDSDIRDSLEQLHEAAFVWSVSCARGDREEAKEILQSAYMKILQGKATFSGRSSFKTWWFAVIRNTGSDRRRKATYRKVLFFEWLSGTPEARSESPESEAIANDQARTIRAALEELPERQREVIDLVFYHDLSLTEASDVMGVSIGTARTHYHRGKEALRDALDKKEADYVSA